MASDYLITVHSDKVITVHSDEVITVHSEYTLSKTEWKPARRSNQ